MHVEVWIMAESGTSNGGVVALRYPLGELPAGYRYEVVLREGEGRRFLPEPEAMTKILQGHAP